MTDHELELVETMNRPSAPDLSSAVFALYGRVMYAVQDLELALANLLGWATTPDTEPWSALTEKVVRAYRRPMGPLLNGLQEAAFPEQLMTDLASALADRNYLVHHFFRRTDGDIHSIEVCKRMLAELTEMELRFHALTERVWNEWNTRLERGVAAGAAQLKARVS